MKHDSKIRREHVHSKVEAIKKAMKKHEGKETKKDEKEEEKKYGKVKEDKYEKNQLM